MDLLALLTAGKVEEFNANRGQRRRIDLFAVELAGAKLAGVDLSGAVLEKSDLTGADLTTANLMKTDLSGVDATEADFTGASAVSAKLREAVLDDANLEDMDVSHADLSEASLLRAQGRGLRASNARFRETDLTEADLDEGSFVEARFHQAKAIKTSFVEADFSEASAQETDFTDANFTGAMLPQARLAGSTFVRAKFNGARLEDAHLQGCDLTGADLTGANLRRANLTEATLTGAKLAGADLSDAVLDKVDFTGLDLTGVVLAGVDPHALGLTEAQIESLAAAGAVVDHAAPLRFTDVSVAAHRDALAVLWENADGEEAMSLRWALVKSDGSAVNGALPLSADGVLARSIVPTAAGFALIILHERPGGAAIVVWRLSKDGTLTPAKADPLGYEPGVRPVVRWSDGVLRVWGLSRRGPMLVVQKVDEQGVSIVSSEKAPTARGFIPGPGAVLACKGGVVLNVGNEGAGQPLRTPSDFPGKMSIAVPIGDRVGALWVVERDGDTPGGVRYAWLAKGSVPKPKALADTAGQVAALDATFDGDRVVAAWIEIARKGTSIRTGELDGEVTTLTLEDVDPEEIKFAACAPGVGPTLALVTSDEGLVIATLDGKIRARIG